MNKFKPVLSICIPCYKRINQVRNTLNSIYEANSEISMYGAQNEAYKTIY